MDNDLITEMLQLTADIAEELLQAKDDGLMRPESATCRKIERLYQMSDMQIPENMDETDGASECVAQTECVAEHEHECFAEHEHEYVSEHNVEAASDSSHDTEVSEIESEAEHDVEVEESEAELATVDVSEPEAASEIQYDSESERESEAFEGEEAADALPDGPSADDLRRAMSINDIFLFRRTLFGGSDQRMRDALADISRCSGIDEISRLLVDKYGVNLRQPEAKAFISIIQPFFDL